MPFKKCPQCGKVNSIKHKVCPKCNASLIDSRPATVAGFGGTPAAHAPSAFTPTPPPAATPQPNPFNSTAAAGAFGQPQQSPFGTAATNAPSPFGNSHQNAPSDMAQHQPIDSPSPFGNATPTAGTPASTVQTPARPDAMPQRQTMKFCPGCGSKIIPGAKFCGNCGTQLTATTPAAQQTAPAGTDNGIAVKKAPASIPSKKNPYFR